MSDAPNHAALADAVFAAVAELNKAMHAAVRAGLLIDIEEGMPKTFRLDEPPMRSFSATVSKTFEPTWRGDLVTGAQTADESREG